MISRRNVLLSLGTGMLVPATGFAQALDRKYRLGVVASSDSAVKDAHWGAFFQRLRELGLVEGRNLVIERRHADNRMERLPALAAELARLKCDVFFCGGAQAILAALTAASRDTPIVIVAVDFDPVATGDVASLARPGGNATGLTLLGVELSGKKLEILRTAMPKVKVVAMLVNPANPQAAPLQKEAEGAARSLGVRLVPCAAASPADRLILATVRAHRLSAATHDRAVRRDCLVRLGKAR